MGESFRFEIQDEIGVVTFDRPKTLHSLTFDVYADLVELFRDGGRDDRYKVIVITGSGRGFAAAATSTRSSGNCSSATRKGCWNSPG